MPLLLVSYIFFLKPRDIINKYIKYIKIIYNKNNDPQFLDTRIRTKLSYKLNPVKLFIINKFNILNKIIPKENILDN